MTIPNFPLTVQIALYSRGGTANVHRWLKGDFIDLGAIFHKDREAQNFAIYINTKYWKFLHVDLDS